jgi:hypothetical protein
MMKFLSSLGGSQHHKRKSRDKNEPAKEPAKPKPSRTKTAPEAPHAPLLRLPSASSTVSASPRSRRATVTNPSTPTAASSATSASYFSLQPAAASSDARSPSTRRPPASFSGHGIDTSRGPPITLITRGNSDYARRSQQPSEGASAQLQHLASPVESQSSGRPPDEVRHFTPQPQQTNPPATTRQNSSTSTARPAPQHMASSSEESSEDDSAPSRPEYPTAHSGHGATDSGTDDEQNEDLFLNIAESSAPKLRHADTVTRQDRLRVSLPLHSAVPAVQPLTAQSRVTRVNQRQSLPSAPSPAPASVTTPVTVSRIPATEPRSNGRRTSHLPSSSRTQQERPPLSPATPVDSPRTRLPDLNTKASFSSRHDAQLSPHEFLAQFGRRRPSQPETLLTPPNRTGTYRPSNLGHYSSSRDDTRTPHIETAPQETSSRADGTESHGSTGPAVSVWDELDELKSRIRRIELGGKIPATSGQVISQAIAERPRTANTSATTVSSSPNQQRKTVASPSESTVGAPTPNRIHPLLREALAKAKLHTPPAVSRSLDAAASEALTLAEMTGSAGPQGTLHSASSILGGANSADRQVRRKADNICRSLTELCIAMCDTKSSLASPAVRSSAASISRRPSVQLNGDSPTVRQSIEPEANTSSGISPSRALSRIEARRSSLFTNGNRRESSQEPQESERIPSRLQRAGTNLHRTHQSFDDDDDDPIPRAPSRAMTDFRAMRSTDNNRYSRQYTSREPMPLQPAPSLQSTASLRRPTVSGTGNENNSLLFRDGTRRYDFERESSPAYEKQTAGTVRARAQLNASRNPNNRNSIGGVSEFRNVNLGRRQRGNSTGE